MEQDHITLRKTMTKIGGLQVDYKCPCIEGSHVIDLQFEEWMIFAKLVRDLGENQNVHYIGNGKTYIVPRIYIAKHGLKGKDLPLLGFKEGMEWKEEDNKRISKVTLVKKEKK